MSGTDVWSVCVRDTAGRVVLEDDPDRVLRTASVGKILLLCECARLLESGERDPATPLTREADDMVADSGLWHRLAVDTLPLADVAALVAAVSDNLATNVLLRHIGLDRVELLRASLGLDATRLLDRVRSTRGPASGTVPWTLSTGSATELSLLAHRLGTGTALSAGADARVTAWLAGNVDLSMVASAFVARRAVDPLAHRDADRPQVRLWNKTGTDDGVRVDVGRVEAGGGAYAYAACAGWDPEQPDHGGPAAAALARMRDVGDWLVARLFPGSG